MSIPQVFKATVVVLTTLAVAYILYVSAEILLTLLMSIIIASAVRPGLNQLRKLRIPEPVAIVFIYGTIVALVGVVLFVIVPPMFNQFAIYIEQDWRLASRIIQAQSFVERYLSDFTQDQVSLVPAQQINESVSLFVTEFRSILPSLIQNMGSLLVGAVLIVVMGAYWLTSHLQAKRFILELTSPKYREEARNVINDIEQTLGGYVRGVVIIASIVGILNFVPLYVLDVPNALTIAFVIGILTMIPVVGGMIGGVVGVLLTLTIDPTKAIIVAIVYIIVAQFENYVLQPRVMSDEVGINPLLVIVYTSIGFLVGGLIGGLVAIPTMGALHILLEHLVINPYRQKVSDGSPEELVVEIDEGDEIIVKKGEENKEDDS